MCFDLLWNTGFFVKLTQLGLLQKMQVTSNWISNNSENILFNHTTLPLAEQAAKHFSSTVLNATHDYFLVNHEIMLDPKLKHHPNVLFL